MARLAVWCEKLVPYDDRDVLDAIDRCVSGKADINPAHCPTLAQLLIEVGKRVEMRRLAERKANRTIVPITSRAVLPANHFLNKLKALAATEDAS